MHVHTLFFLFAFDYNGIFGKRWLCCTGLNSDYLCTGIQIICAVNIAVDSELWLQCRHQVRRSDSNQLETHEQPSEKEKESGSRGLRHALCLLPDWICFQFLVLCTLASFQLWKSPNANVGLHLSVIVLLFRLMSFGLLLFLVSQLTTQHSLCVCDVFSVKQIAFKMSEAAEILSSV